MKNRIFLVSLFLLLLAGCSGINLIITGKPSNLYSEKFLVEVGKIKEQYRQGQIDEALANLKTMNEETLLPVERSLRRNLMGVIFFSKGKYEQSVFNFDLALTTSSLDEALTAQIHLNLASSYFKLGFMEKAFATLAVADFTKLNKAEEKKFHLLKYNAAKELGREGDVLISLVHYLGEMKTLTELKQSPYYEIMVSSFFKLTNSEKVRFIEEFEKQKFLCIAYLGYLQAEKLYYKNEKDNAKDLLEWINDKFENHAEILTLVKNFFFRMERYTKMNDRAIGIVLPMTGSRKNFGERAILGIDTALKEIQAQYPEAHLKIFVRDSKGSGAVGAQKVKELIERDFVSIVIGGLFSAEATKEYIEAKKHGAVFISLSQIYLPKEEKDHLLLEIPGSVESQVNKLFTEEMLTSFGTRTAIIFPESTRGEAYVNEFWRKAKLKNVQVTGALSFKESDTDFRELVRNILGLKFTRERQEELDLLSEVQSLEKNTTTRRIQVLKPEVDFDWIFIPAFPRQALQIVPSFTYYDAFHLNIFGGPSWRSQALSRESYKLGRIHFIGDDTSKGQEKFMEQFIELHKSRPKLIELMSYDSMLVTAALIAKKRFDSRDELDLYVKEKGELAGVTGRWLIDEGVWLKDMATLRLRKNNIEKVFTQASN